MNRNPRSDIEIPEKCKVVAEGCCNHKGDIDIALEMTDAAKMSGADYIKWQKRVPEESVQKEVLDRSHPNWYHSYGKTYLDHRVALEFSIDQHVMLKKHSEKIGIGYSVSVWDLTSAKEMISLCDDFIKIPSAANFDFDLIEWILDNYKGQVHISLGMTDPSERERIFKRLAGYDDKIVYYHTTTIYPCDFDKLHLGEIKSLAKRFQNVGYSGHHKGIAVDIMAYAFGATWIERHFTLDRTARGTDHAASLEPVGLDKMTRDLKAAYLAASKKVKMDDDEKKSEIKLRTPNGQK